MDFIEPFLLALSLSLDCFAISISQGLKSNKSKNFLITLAILFGLFQSGMFVIGFYIGSFILSFFSIGITNWIAAGLLLYIGIKMIKEGVDKNDEEIKVSNFKEYILLSIATSIDAMAAGVSFISIKTDFIQTSILVGIISFIMSIIGGFAGEKIGNKFGKHAEVFGGIVLIGLSIKTILSAM